MQKFLPQLCQWPGLLLLLLLAGIPLYAQQPVTGRVISGSDQQPLIGATVKVKNSNRGGVTDVNGRFSVNAAMNEVLQVSAMGYQSAEVTVTSPDGVTITLAPDQRALGEVVVTALGISRAKKSLGYAAQEVKGAELDKARETNFVSGLAGKVAGITVMSSPSGVGGSARMTIRGDKSLDLNKNQPLFVIDGVPIANDLYGSSGKSYQEVDYGNGASLINPDDIESMTVLKGANAAALYGSRAANGVIVITTKSGKGNKGLGVSVNTGVTFEKPLVLPKFQQVYGQGLDGQFSFSDGSNGGINDGVDESWGPRFDGQLIPQFDSPTKNGYRGGDVNLVDDGAIGSAADLAARGEIIPTPWLNKMNLKDFYETGITTNTNVALTGANDKGDFRVSYTLLDQQGIIPNNDLRRNTFALNGGYQLSPRLSVRATANYINTSSDNRPNLSYGTESIIYLLHCWMGQQVDLRNLRNYWMPGRENMQQFNFNYNYHDNPYFNLFENTNGQKADRLFGNIAVKYDFTNWLSLQLRGGTDINNERRERRRAFSTQRFPFGSYREERLQATETNLDFLFTANREFGKFSLVANAGGNKRIVNNNFTNLLAPQLLIPGIYSLNNARVPLESEVYDGNKVVNSLYSSVQLGWNNYLFLDLTARNDWSSSLVLPEDVDSLGNTKSSYFYPSASLSAIVSDMTRLPSWISYGKVRVSVAQVGNDTDPYRFTTGYTRLNPFGGNQAFTSSSVLANYNLKPEISTSFETGLEWKFLNNRIGIDFTYYNISTRNQILPNVPVSSASGWTRSVLNAGKVRNWGYEVMLNATPLIIKQFQWDININFSRNNSKVLELAEGVDNYVMAGKEAISIEARVGNRMGDMYGYAYKRVEDPKSAYYGQIIFNDRGRPQRTENIVRLGNYNPDWLAGVRNSFSYRGINASVLFDIRQGGKVFSLTQVVGREAGELAETLEGRADGYDLSRPGNGVIGAGVVQLADGSYTPNTYKVSAREWHTAFTDGRSIAEPVTYDASFVKLREIRLGYTLPASWLQRTGLRNVTLSAVARNLAVWSDVPHIDPEATALSGGTIVPGVESVAMPTTRSMGFNLSFNF